MSLTGHCVSATLRDNWPKNTAIVFELHLLGCMESSLVVSAHVFKWVRRMLHWGGATYFLPICCVCMNCKLSFVVQCFVLIHFLWKRLQWCLPVLLCWAFAATETLILIFESPLWWICHCTPYVSSRLVLKSFLSLLEQISVCHLFFFVSGIQSVRKRGVTGQKHTQRWRRASNVVGSACVQVSLKN